VFDRCDLNRQLGGDVTRKTPFFSKAIYYFLPMAPRLVEPPHNGEITPTPFFLLLNNTHLFDSVNARLAGKEKAFVILATIITMDFWSCWSFWVGVK
jgi:hypothetical protein